MMMRLTVTAPRRSTMHRSVRSRARRLVPAAAVIVLLVATSPSAAAGGKPGYPDTVTWRSDSWQVKTSRSPVGPGPNVFARENVSVDPVTDDLHLQITRNASGVWTTAEVISPRSYGYGTYTFELASRVDSFDANVVLGLFTWSDKAPYAHREIDIELARWGNAADTTNGQYVVQPYDKANHLRRFTQGALGTSIQRFTWRAGSIAWETRDAANGLVASYTYTGAGVPVPGDERVRLNLWLYQGAAPSDGAPVDVAIRSFTFTP